MNDDHDEFDARLAQLFRREHAHVPAEPFAAATLRAIAAERKRATLRNWLLRAAAVITLAFLAPRLVDISVKVSTGLDELFASASAWLASPLGLVVGVLGALVALAAKQLRIW